MADLEIAGVVLRGLRRDIQEAEPGRFVAVFGDQTFSITSAEIDMYLARKAEIKRENETQYFVGGHYEHVVQFEGVGIRRYPRRDAPLSLQNDQGTRIEIGRPSVLFVLSLTDVDQLDRSLRRHMSLALINRTREQRTLSELFRFSTIKVLATPDSALGRSIQRMHNLAEAAIFHFAFGQGLSISFTKSWERTYYWLGRKEREAVQFPRRTYNSELVSYYNLALGSDSLVLGFLALYKILEYFYTSVSENTLHQKVREMIAAPDFLPSKPKKLRELIKTIRQFDTRLDELGALKLVLETYFEKAGLRCWIEEYEGLNGPYFTQNAQVFNSTMRIDTNDASIVGNIAARIYAIRNALVHNKEGELARFVPYSGQEETLQKEVQILLHVAEQLIIKTGKDID
jgi:hypothetical protein